MGDSEAEEFARSFYTDMMAGRTLGEAVVLGRRVVRELESRDWANYILYGNSDFVLKEAAM